MPQASSWGNGQRLLRLCSTTEDGWEVISCSLAELESGCVEISRVLDSWVMGWVVEPARQRGSGWVKRGGVGGVIGRNKFVLRRRMFECSTIRQQIGGWSSAARERRVAELPRTTCNSPVITKSISHPNTRRAAGSVAWMRRSPVQREKFSDCDYQPRKSFVDTPASRL